MAPLTPRNSTQYGFTPQAGTDYTYGQEPQIASRLGRLARSLHLRLTGISGYRTPAHSVAVGGNANDPHTRGEASDTGGAENIPESTLERFGLTRPFAGTREANHIQLLSGGTAAPKRTRNVTIADEWISNGGSRRLAPIMAAISMAESGGRLNAVSPPNTDGSVDYGPFQVNSVHGYDPHKLTTDWAYTTRAAIAIEKSQGLTAWTTYTSGAYKKFMGSAASATANFPARTRPGGESTTDDGSGVETIFADYQSGTSQDASFFSDLFNNPLGLTYKKKKDGSGGGFADLFNDPAKAINSTADFLKWIAWIFHPANILRAVEFVSGLTLIIIGVQSMYEVWREAPEKTIVARSGRAAKTGAKSAASASPAGRAVRAKRAARFGKQQAKQEKRTTEARSTARKAKVREQKRQHEGRVRRSTRKQEDIPF